MARKKQSAPAPPPAPEPRKKGLLSRWDRIFLIICILIFAYIGLKKCGVEFVSKSDEYELLDDPHK